MVLTKLLNVRTFELEQYDLESMPPYVAVSHVWADNLYPPEWANSITAAQTQGMKMLTSTLKHENLQNVNHCWVDTWCIDQNDEADKEIQIPRMNTVYRNAQAMAITVKHIFSFSQQDWNEVMDRFKDDLHWFDFGWGMGSDTLGDHARLQEFVTKPDALRAMGYVLEVAGLHWNTRIWTAQGLFTHQFATAETKRSRIRACSKSSLGRQQSEHT